MKDDNISLLEGRRLAHALEYLKEIFKESDFPKEISMALLDSMRKVAMSGRMNSRVATELTYLLEKAVENYLEKLTNPLTGSGTEETSDPELIAKDFREEPLSQKVPEPIPVPERQPVISSQVISERLEEKSMPDKVSDHVQIFPRIGQNGKCEIESRLSFPIMQTKLSLFLDVVSNPEYAISKVLWDDIASREIERIRKRISQQAKKLSKIILIEKETTISIKNEDRVYGLTFIAGDNGSILIWTKDDRVVPWGKPEKIPLIDILSPEGVELEQLRCLIMIKGPGGGRMEVDFIKFVK